MRRLLSLILTAAALTITLAACGRTAPTLRPVVDPHVSGSTILPAPHHSKRAGLAIADTLTLSNGTWSGSPTSYTYQWEDCNRTGASCTAISGATSSSYTVTSSDLGYTIAGVVTAHKSTTSVSKTSASTQLVTYGMDGIYASGSELVSNTGTQIHLHGVNVEGTEYQCAHSNGIFDTANTATNAADMASWHVNFVRLGLNATCVDCVEGVPTADCGSNYMGAIEQWVDLLNSYGIYVEVGLMWDYPCSPNGCTSNVVTSNSYQLAGGPTEDNAPGAWAAMATDFKNNPDVILGISGEDYNQFSCRTPGGVCQSSQLPATATTTTTTAAVSAGAITSLPVASVPYQLLNGETIWEGDGTTALTVTANVAATSSATSIPVSGTATALASGGSIYLPEADIGDHVGMTITGTSVTEDFTTAGAQQAVNIMRADGFAGPIVYTCADIANVCSDPTVAGGTGSAYYGGNWLANHPTDPDNELVAAADLYGPSASYGNQACSGSTCWTDTVLPIIQAGHPFILNEYGPSSDETNCGTSYTTATGGMLPWMDANGAAGYAAWSWFDNSGTCADLVSSYTSPTPNTNGAFAAGVQSYYQTNFGANWTP